MNSLTEKSDNTLAPDKLQIAFLGWQCRIRQKAIRQNGGQPNKGMLAKITLPTKNPASFEVITVLCRLPEASKNAELMHIAKNTHDPAERRENAIRFFSAGYYQERRLFSDMLVAAFPPNSSKIEELIYAKKCQLDIEAFSTHFKLSCKPKLLDNHHPSRVACHFHNFLFNPYQLPNTKYIGFEVDWYQSIQLHSL